jgi:hypothetical protein
VRQPFTIASAGLFLLSWYDTTPVYLDCSTNSPYSASILTNTLQIIVIVTNDAYHGTTTWQGHSLQVALTPGKYYVRFRAEFPVGHIMAAIYNVSLVRLGPPALTATATSTNLTISWPD